MSDVYGVEGPPPIVPKGPAGGGAPSIIINNIPPKQPWMGKSFTRILLVVLLLLNLYQLSIGMQYYQAWYRAGEEYVSGSTTSSDKVAIIDVASIITSATVRAPIREMEYAQRDEGVKAIVLRVNSPGGEVGATDSLYRAIETFKNKSNKPVIVWMENVAASGAFWVSMAGDVVLAGDLCTTGSIGVYLNAISIEGLLEEWKIDAKTIKTGPYKDTGSLFRDLTAEDEAELRKLIDAWFVAFKDVIWRHRKDKIVGGQDKLNEIADGRVFLAPEALTLGLIDKIGYLDDAIEEAKAKAGITTEVRVVKYKRSVSFVDLLQSKSSAEGSLSVDKFLELQVPRILAMPARFTGGWTPAAK